MGVFCRSVDANPPSAMSFLTRVYFFVTFAVFFSFGYVQLNDPDAWLWATAYWVAGSLVSLCGGFIHWKAQLPGGKLTNSAFSLFSDNQVLVNTGKFFSRACAIAALMLTAHMPSSLVTVMQDHPHFEKTTTLRVLLMEALELEEFREMCGIFITSVHAFTVFWMLKVVENELEAKAKAGEGKKKDEAAPPQSSSTVAKVVAYGLLFASIGLCSGSIYIWYVTLGLKVPGEHAPHCEGML